MITTKANERSPSVNSGTGVLFCLLALFAGVFFSTLSDYGIVWDIAVGEILIGEKNFYFYKTLDTGYLEYGRDDIPVYKDPAHPDFQATSGLNVAHPEYAWPLALTFSSLCKHIFFTKLRFMDPIDAHHTVQFFFSALLIGILFWWLKKRFSIEVATVAIILLFVSPRFWSEVPNNLKDFPHTALHVASLVVLYEAFANQSLKQFAIGGGLLGAALATKANALFIPLELSFAYLTLLICNFHQTRWLRLFTAPFVILAVGATVFFAAWPGILVDFPNLLLKHKDYLVMMGSRGPDEWQKTPLLYAFGTTPLALLVLAGLGILILFLQAWKNKNLRGIFALLVVWLILPVLRVCRPKAFDYDGIRHWLEYYPALIIFAAIALVTVSSYFGLLLKTERVRPILAALTFMVVTPLLSWHLRYHPYQECFFNSWMGGLGGAQKIGLHRATDYWGNSYRSGMRWMNAHAEKDATLMVGVADHIVGATKKIWLRPDLKFQTLAEFNALYPDIFSTDPAAPKPTGDVYVMALGRHDFSPPLIYKLEDERKAAFEVIVDSGRAMSIFKISSAN